MNYQKNEVIWDSFCGSYNVFLALERFTVAFKGKFVDNTSLATNQKQQYYSVIIFISNHKIMIFIILVWAYLAHDYGFSGMASQNVTYRQGIGHFYIFSVFCFLSKVSCLGH